jgi:hypothetical protein
MLHRQTCTARMGMPARGTCSAYPAGSATGKEPGHAKTQIKDEKTYQELRTHGASKEKSARIANASARTSRHVVAAKGGKRPSDTDWSKADLLRRARDIGIKGRSSMNKKQLIDALRNH